MKASSTLSWRYLVSKIHHQLPLNRRESQKLLALLQTSFRQQLDRQHQVTLSDSRNATNHHLQSILKNPLFEAGATKRRLSSSNQRSGSQLGLFQELLERPITYFKEHVVAGTATLDIAKLCLTAQYEKLSQSSSAGPVASTKSSETGSIILSWLWSSGIAESKSFLNDKRFLNLLIPFLVIEGQGDLIWRWIMQLQPNLDHGLRGPILFARRRYLLFKLVEAEAKHGRGLIPSLNIFMEKLREIWSSPNPFNYISQGLFHGAGAYLCMELAKTSESNTVEVDKYGELYQTVVSWSSRPFYHRGMMELHHPQNPTTASALRYLSEWEHAKLDRKSTVRLGLKAAEISLNNDAQADALWVFDFLKSNFADELGLSSTARDSSKDLAQEEKPVGQEEQISLRSLEALEVH